MGVTESSQKKLGSGRVSRNHISTGSRHPRRGHPILMEAAESPQGRPNLGRRSRNPRRDHHIVRGSRNPRNRKPNFEKCHGVKLWWGSRYPCKRISILTEATESPQGRPNFGRRSRIPRRDKHILMGATESPQRKPNCDGRGVGERNPRRDNTICLGIAVSSQKKPECGRVSRNQI